MSQPIYLYNTLTRKKEEFVPVKRKQAGFYLCGPTVYDYPTIGNYRTYILGDLINRIFLYNGYKVRYVQNITDVGHLVSDQDEGEDKLEKGARREGKTAEEVASFFTEEYKKECGQLNIKEPTVWCRAADKKNIDLQINMIKKLEDKGFTYKTSDGIYFDTSKQKNYGELARLNLEGLREGARVEINPEKKNMTDFALWKFSPKNEQRHMEWSSPWGTGFPGWHIECSAMSIEYLGQPFDIHAGAIDLIPVHHTNEIAQNEAVYGHKAVNYWIHGGFLMVEEKKMGKSLGNAYKLSDIILSDVVKEEFNPLVFRYLTFNTQYRQPLNFTWTAFGEAGQAMSKLYKTVARMMSDDNIDNQTNPNLEWDTKFLEAINDDLNMPKALAVMWEMLKDQSLSDNTKLATLYKFDEVFGLDIKNTATKYVALFSKELDSLIEKREAARRAKNWNEADEIRRKINELGYTIEDREENQRPVIIKTRIQF